MVYFNSTRIFSNHLLAISRATFDPPVALSKKVSRTSPVGGKQSIARTTSSITNIELESTYKRGGTRDLDDSHRHNKTRDIDLDQDTFIPLTEIPPERSQTKAPSRTKDLSTVSHNKDRSTSFSEKSENPKIPQAAPVRVKDLGSETKNPPAPSRTKNLHTDGKNILGATSSADPLSFNQIYDLSDS